MVILGLIVIAIGRALLAIPVGTAYVVFTGVGAVGTAALGIFVFGESAASLRLACIGLIVAAAMAPPRAVFKLRTEPLGRPASRAP